MAEWQREAAAAIGKVESPALNEDCGLLQSNSTGDVGRDVHDPFSARRHLRLIKREVACLASHLLRAQTASSRGDGQAGSRGGHTVPQDDFKTS